MSETIIGVDRATDAPEDASRSGRNGLSSSGNESRDSTNRDEVPRTVESSPEVAETFISKAPQKNLKSNAAAATEFSLDSGLARDQPGAKVDAATN
jgi:hypothetical protein